MRNRKVVILGARKSRHICRPLNAMILDGLRFSSDIFEARMVGSFEKGGARSPATSDARFLNAISD